MATRKLPRGAVGAMSEGELDERHFLGRVATFTHPEEWVGGSKVIRAWSKAGLDIEDAPKVRSDAHVFQSACRSVETRRPSNGGGLVEVKVDEVLDNANECVYQVTRMVRDRAERLIDHPKAMRVSFTKATSEITVDALEDYDALRGLEESIREHVAKHGKSIHSQKIRNAIRDVLLKIGGQNLRRKAGGLYFVPVTYIKSDAHGGAQQTLPTKPVLDGLHDFLADIYGDAADFYTIPLVNDEGAQEMVRKHFTINAGVKTRELLEDALQRLRQGRGERRVRQELLVRLHNERRRLGGAVDQFDSLVGVERKQIEQDLRDLDKALSDLQDLADAPKEKP
jgi:hypothetical protein